MGFFRKVKPNPTAERPAGRDTPRRAYGPVVDISIVGEASYQPQIRRVVRAVGPNEFEIVLRADLGNRYDPSAVAVYALGVIVGYLPRRMAAAWQPAVLRAEWQGLVVCGTAQVFGGSQDKPSLGVFGNATWPGDGPPLDRWHMEA